MIQDKKQQLLDNLTEQWMNLSAHDKAETVEDLMGVTVICTTLINSARLAGKGNWPAAFYNLAIGGGLFALFAAHS